MTGHPVQSLAWARRPDDPLHRVGLAAQVARNVLAPRVVHPVHLGRRAGVACQGRRSHQGAHGRFGHAAVCPSAARRAMRAANQGTHPPADSARPRTSRGPAARVLGWCFNDPAYQQLHLFSSLPHGCPRCAPGRATAAPWRWPHRLRRAGSLPASPPPARFERARRPCVRLRAWSKAQAREHQWRGAVGRQSTCGGAASWDAQPRAAGA